MLTSYATPERSASNFLEGQVAFSHPRLSNNRSVMPLDVRGCTRATLTGSACVYPTPTGAGNPGGVRPSGSAPGGAARPRPRRGPLRGETKEDGRSREGGRPDGRSSCARARTERERRRGEAGARGGLSRPTLPPRVGFGLGKAARGADPRALRPPDACGTGWRRAPDVRGGADWRCPASARSCGRG
uniref:Uncharacterized protein n=1 Tax=Laticauda laticaudata TaxID=8630 RepID=A0A8C5RHJ3_LATLA